MAEDHIRYDLLAQAALLGVVRGVLADAAKNGLPGEHHFKISFATAAPGVRLSDRMRAQYPQNMTIVLQHQFWDLAVREDAFEVGLSFGGVAEKLTIPFEAVTAFFDPAVQFGLQFAPTDAEAATGVTPAPKRRGRRSSPKRQPASPPRPTLFRFQKRSRKRRPALAPKWSASIGSERNRTASGDAYFPLIPAKAGIWHLDSYSRGDSGAKTIFRS